MEATVYVSRKYNRTTVPITLSAMLGMQAACLCSKQKCIHVQFTSTVKFLASKKSSEMGVLQVKVLFQKNNYRYIVPSRGTMASCLVCLHPNRAAWVGPWLGTLCCVLKRDTLLSQYLSPPRCVNAYGEFNAGK